MLAKDVMTRNVVTVKPDEHVRDIAKLLLKKRVSAVPVVDSSGKLQGIVSEGDLMRRKETESERHSSWWLALVSSPDKRALDYVKSHSVHTADVMTRDVITVNEEATVQEIADILESHHIKRVPVVAGDRLVGIVSRADLLRALASGTSTDNVNSGTDRQLREKVENAIQEPGVDVRLVSVVVSDGVVVLWGAVDSDAEKQAIRVAAESVAGIKQVEDKMSVLSPMVQSLMWAE